MEPIEGRCNDLDKTGERLLRCHGRVAQTRQRDGVPEARCLGVMIAGGEWVSPAGSDVPRRPAEHAQSCTARPLHQAKRKPLHPEPTLAPQQPTSVIQPLSGPVSCRVGCCTANVGERVGSSPPTAPKATKATQGHPSFHYGTNSEAPATETRRAAHTLTSLRR